MRDSQCRGKHFLNKTIRLLLLHRRCCFTAGHGICCGIMSRCDGRYVSPRMNQTYLGWHCAHTYKPPHAVSAFLFAATQTSTTLRRHNLPEVRMSANSDEPLSLLPPVRPKYPTHQLCFSNLHITLHYLLFRLVFKKPLPENEIGAIVTPCLQVTVTNSSLISLEQHDLDQCMSLLVSWYGLCTVVSSHN